MKKNDSESPLVSLSDVRLELSSQAGQVDILRGIDLRIDVGETVSITGPSGAGKTSLMMIIGGLEKPTGGTVSVAGMTLNNLDEDALALYRRNHVGIVFQSFHLIPTMTALENVAIPLELSGKPDAFERAAQELDQVGLAARAMHFPDQLSGGEQQRVALARALVTEPNLVLADEPTGNLDGENSMRVMDMMFELSEAKSITLVLITHQNDIALRCKRNLQMADGRIIGGASV